MSHDSLQLWPVTLNSRLTTKSLRGEYFKTRISNVQDLGPEGSTEPVILTVGAGAQDVGSESQRCTAADGQD